MVTVPASTPVTTPCRTVATAMSELVQGDVAAAVPDPVSVVEAPTHRLVVPLMAGVIQVSLKFFK